MSRKKPTINDLLREKLFLLTYERFKHLAIDRFEWDGLPNGMKPQYIESSLFEHGKALFIKDPILGFLCLPCNPDGGMNVYGEFLQYRAFGMGYDKSFDVDGDCVLIKNNPSMSSSHDVVMVYSNRITELEKTMMVNITQQKTPYIVACNEKDLLTLKNIFNKVSEGEPVIYADKQLQLDTLDVHLTNAPYVADKLMLHKHEVENEMLTLLGINNANTDKKERLITDEVNANNQFIMMNVSYMLQMRQQAVEEINQKFGLNITVKLKEVEHGTIHPNPKTVEGE